MAKETQNRRHTLYFATRGSISWNSVPHVKTGTAFSLFLSSMEVI